MSTPESTPTHVPWPWPESTLILSQGLRIWPLNFSYSKEHSQDCLELCPASFFIHWNLSIKFIFKLPFFSYIFPYFLDFELSLPVCVFEKVCILSLTLLSILRPLLLVIMKAIFKKRTPIYVVVTEGTGGPARLVDNLYSYSVPSLPPFIVIKFQHCV